MSVGGGPSLAQNQLAAELARLRSLAGLDQREIAARVGVSQATVSRIERALKLPTRSNVIAWANACGAAADVVKRITALTEVAHTQVETWRELASRSPHLQDAVQANEATAATLRNYSPIVVPGLLQTAEYARQVLALTDITGQLDVAAGVEGRLRRQEALHDPARRFEFLTTEAALRRPLGTLTGHAVQLDRIVIVHPGERLGQSLTRRQLGRCAASPRFRDLRRQRRGRPLRHRGDGARLRDHH